MLPTFMQYANGTVACTEPNYSEVVKNEFKIWATNLLLYQLLGSEPGVQPADRPVSHQQLIDFGQLAFLVLPANSIANFLSVFNLQIPYSADDGSCPYHSTYYTQFIVVMLRPLISAVELIIGAVIARFIVPLITGRPFNWRGWTVYPLIIMMTAQYQPLTVAALQMLDCRQVGPFKVLRHAPAYLCSGSVYAVYKAISIAVICCITCAIPIALFILWLRVRRDADKTLKFAIFYGPYQTRYGWFASVNLLRRLMLIALLLIPDGANAIRVLCQALWCVALFGSQLLFRPSVSRMVSIGEQLSLFSVMVIAVMSMAAQMIDPQVNPQQYVGVGWSVLVVVAATGITLVVLVVYGLRETIKQVFRWLPQFVPPALMAHYPRCYSCLQRCGCCRCRNQKMESKSMELKDLLIDKESSMHQL